MIRTHMKIGGRGNVWSGARDDASKIDASVPFLDITRRQGLPPRGCEHGPHEAYTLLVLPAPVSSVHRESFNYIHVIAHPENAWLLLDPKLSFLH
jgi:hypothetical protein